MTAPWLAAKDVTQVARKKHFQACTTYYTKVEKKPWKPGSKWKLLLTKKEAMDYLRRFFAGPSDRFYKEAWMPLFVPPLQVSQVVYRCWVPSFIITKGALRRPKTMIAIHPSHPKIDLSRPSMTYYELRWSNALRWWGGHHKLSLDLLF